MTDAARLQKMLKTAGWLTLAAGGLSSLAIYLTATPDEQYGLMEGFRGSKTYHHELEAYGGKLNLVFDELANWFASLWQGEALAMTIAFSAAGVALLLFFAARRVGATASGRENHHGKSEEKG